MDAPLNNCTIKEQHAIVSYLWAEGVKPAEIHHWRLTLYGANTMN